MMLQSNKQYAVVVTKAKVTDIFFWLAMVKCR